MLKNKKISGIFIKSRKNAGNHINLKNDQLKEKRNND